MAENRKESFFDKFGKFKKEELGTPAKIVESIEEGAEAAPERSEAKIETSGKILEEFSKDESANADSSIEKSDFSIESVPSLEISQANKELIEKKEYWEKLINSIRAEKLSQDELENKELQNKKILEEILNILIEKEKEIIQKGEATQVVKLFREIVLPTIKKEDSEINEAYYWDEFHAKIVTVENIPDLS